LPMFRLLLSIVLVLAFGLQGGSSAAECTAAEDQSITDAYTAAAATSACSSYASTGILIMITPPCSATDCIAVMQDLANTIPNCTSSSVSTSEKDQIIQSLSICATPAPTPASTASSTNCTSSEAEETFNAFYTAATGDVCASAATIDSYSVVIEAPCNSTCATTIRDFAAALPNCNYELAYESTNKKEDIGTQFTICEGVSNDTNVSVSINTDHDLIGSTDGTTSALVANCTTDEVQQTLEYFLAVATNESCQNNASICSYDISVFAGCSTPCGELVQELWSDLPECYYDGTDHMQTVLDSWSQCDFWLTPDPISISFHYSEDIDAGINTTVPCNPSDASTSDSNSQEGSTAPGNFLGFSLMASIAIALTAVVL